MKMNYHHHIENFSTTLYIENDYGNRNASENITCKETEMNKLES